MFDWQAVPTVTGTAVALGGGELASAVGAFTAIQGARFTTPCIARSRGSVALFWPPWAPANVLYTCARTYTQTRTRCFKSLRRLTPPLPQSTPPATLKRHVQLATHASYLLNDWRVRLPTFLNNGHLGDEIGKTPPADWLFLASLPQENHWKGQVPALQ